MQDVLDRFVLSRDDLLYAGKVLSKYFKPAGPENLKWARKDCPYCFASFSVVKLRKRMRCSRCRRIVSYAVQTQKKGQEVPS